MKNLYFMFVVLCSVVYSCVRPPRSFMHTAQPLPPDYEQRKYWAALPDKKDSADFEMPYYGIIDGQQNAKADVFFIPPTNYIEGRHWNVSLDDSAANAVTDNVGCKLLASAYNGSCKVYVPRYRTAILYSYFASGKNAKLSFGLAYKDVEAAFLYYMKHYNKGRPIVIAAHSQGTDYAITLVKRFFDKDTALKQQLVAAYLIGRPIYDTTFKVIQPLYSAEQTGGFVVWNSVSYHTNTFYTKPVGKIIGVNPLSWKSDTVYVPATFNKGGLPFTANRIDTAVVDAKLAPSGFLWVNSPSSKSAEEYPGLNSFYYHKDDYAFYYMNIRANVEQRINAYIKKHKK
ncbi:MAG: DUF3089 domain-containing protein [Bacteroidota bacterium]